jgi:hypothetical protein
LLLFQIERGYSIAVRLGASRTPKISRYYFNEGIDPRNEAIRMLSDEKEITVSRLLRWWYLPLVVTLLSGCATDPYFEPSATGAKARHPSLIGSAYGIFPKNTISFSPPNYPIISVSVTAWADHLGHPFRLDIQTDKLYWSDPHIKNLPYDQAQAEIAKDREEVVADAGHIEIDWSSGKQQIVPLSFSHEAGNQTFVISGAPVASITFDGQPQGPPRIALSPAMNIGLERDGGEAFDVKIPAMNFSGHRLEFPVIHFKKMN